MPKTIRSLEQIRSHYEIEKELASRLRKACKVERRHLYSKLYNELYRRVPHHSMLNRKNDLEWSTQKVQQQLKLLKHFLNSMMIFLEVGAGDCRLSVEVAKFVKKVYAVEVSEEISQGLPKIDNFELIISDGISIPIPKIVSRSPIVINLWNICIVMMLLSNFRIFTGS